jgi:hypothetical protein
VQAASRPYVLAGAVLAATSAIAVTPLAPRPFHLPVLSIETRLVDDSILNIPVNLFDDIMNIPYNEIQALDVTAGSEFFTGTWWVPSSTNLWGIDPGDTTHVALVTDLFAPFPALDQGVGGLQYEIDGLLAAELPVSASCDASTCAPMIPPEVITGSTNIDRFIGFLETISGQTQFGLYDNWFKVPLSDLFSGYTFNSANDPGAVNPSGVAYPGFGFPDGSGNPFLGGTGAGGAMPWDGTTYTLNPLQPFVNFYDSLLQTPSTSGFAGTGIEIPTLTDFTQALQNLAAGTIIDFDTFTAGAAFCPASCDIPESVTIPALVQDIENLDPSNTTIQTWLTDYAANPSTVNEPTADQINSSIALVQTGMYNLTPDQLATVDADLASINPELPALLTNAGVYIDPAYLAYTGTGPLDAVYGGHDLNLVGQDLLTLLTNNETNYSALTNLDTLRTLAFPLSAGASSGSAVDPAALSTDLSALLASLGDPSAGALDPAGLSADLSALLSSLSTTLASDLGTQLPSLLTSMF